MRTHDHTTRNPQLETALRETVTRFLAQFENDPCATAQAATWIIDLLTDLEESTAERRRAAVRRMRAEGWTLAQIGAEMGMSRSRVDQIAKQ